MVGHWGLQKCREFLNDPTITDRTITQFICQCPCCQVMSRLKTLIKTHPFTCASCNPFESLHIDHIGPLPVDDKGNSHILVMIDAFSRWVELFPTWTTGASECIFQHFGRFGKPDVIHTDQGPAFRNELFSELSRLSQVEKTSTGVTPAELILNNSTPLSNRILAPGSANPTSRVALSDTMDNWVARQHTLLQVAQAHQHQVDSHLLVEYDPRITEYPVRSYVLFTPPAGRSNKLLPKHRGPFQVMDKTDSIYIIEDLVSGKRITTHIPSAPIRWL
jgi:hypothetical protein